MTGRFGHAAYARMLALTKTPATVAQVVEKTGAQRQTTREILWRMERLGLVHVCGWEEPTGRSSFMAPLFLLGQGVSVPYPRQINRQPLGSKPGRPRAELLAFATIIRLLRHGATRNELHEQTGVAYMRVSNLLRELRRLGLLHTSDWRARDDGCGKPAEVLSFGPGRNAQRPKTLTRAEIDRNNRQRRQAKLKRTASVFHLAARLASVEAFPAANEREAA